MTGHYHIGSNTPGYLPESDIYCVDNMAMAGDALNGEIAKLAEDIREGCDRDGCGYCPWCLASARIAANTGGDAPVLFALEIDADPYGNAYRTFDVPCNPHGVAVWVQTIPSDRTICEHNAVNH